MFYYVVCLKGNDQVCGRIVLKIATAVWTEGVKVCTKERCEEATAAWQSGRAEEVRER